MNLPSFVFPYQRSPSWWNTPVLVFTQTIPFAGGTRVSVVGLAVSLLLPTEGGWGFSAFPAGAAECGAVAAEGPAPPIDTSGAILSIVFLGTPTLERSLTNEYGLPAMIFFAVASPTPGRFSSSAWVAALRSTFAAVGALLLVCAHPPSGLSQLPASNRAMLTARTCDMADLLTRSLRPSSGSDSIRA